MKELEEVEIECGPIRVDDCIGKKMTFLHDPDGCRRDCMNKVGREKLLAADYAKTANAYINYRTEHEHLREMDDELVKIFENLTFRPSEEDDLKRENANINADTAMEIGRASCRERV